MSVVPLTLTISLGLVFSFILMFLREHRRGNRSCSERDSLLPLLEETPRVGTEQTEAAVAADGTTPDHFHGEDDGCGCRSGRRAPCDGCLKRGAERS
jgi:hypothetical protein